MREPPQSGLDVLRLRHRVREQPRLEAAHPPVTAQQHLHPAVDDGDLDQPPTAAQVFEQPTGGFWVVLLGAVITLGLTVIHVWPTQRSVDRVSDSLERSGTRSHLRESLALPPR
jgi:hypothetical protein